MRSICRVELKTEKIRSICAESLVTALRRGGMSENAEAEKNDNSNPAFDLVSGEEGQFETFLVP